MRTIITYTPRANDLPLLSFYVHDAPHRRQHFKVLQLYRDELTAAAKAANIPIPIKVPVAVSALFINPVSTDLDNLLTALLQAIDGNSHRAPTVLADDGLICCLEKVSKFYPEQKK